MQHEIKTTIAIAATPEQVWSVLLDFARYPEWNPFVRSIEGQPSEGSSIKITLSSQGGKPMIFKPIVLRHNPGREFRWKGRLLLPGIFDGEHYFCLSADREGSTQLMHGERFNGLLVPLLRGALDRDTKARFEAMNTALKHRIERRDAYPFVAPAAAPDSR
ncbi:MAG: SRPBCC domain-containing protein [Nitrospira sp.]|nr:SRPBCC domain-containing protein [Nitrospira sp.]